jgi:hypothetical protein
VFIGTAGVTGGSSRDYSNVDGSGSGKPAILARASNPRAYDAAMIRVLASLGLATVLHAQSDTTRDFVWRTDLDAAVAAAADTGKPLLVVFR